MRHTQHSCRTSATQAILSTHQQCISEMRQISRQGPTNQPDGNSARQMGQTCKRPWPAPHGGQDALPESTKHFGNLGSVVRLDLDMLVPFVRVKLSSSPRCLDNSQLESNSKQFPSTMSMASGLIIIITHLRACQ